MKKACQLNELFDRWMKKQAQEPDEDLVYTKISGNAITREHFCKDGIIDESVFEKERIKLLIVSNAAGKSGNLIADRREDYRCYYKSGHDDWKGKQRERYCEMYKLTTGQPAMCTSDAAIHFAVMNINKRGGGRLIGSSGSSGKHMESYCRYYRSEILEEIAIIKPDILIWSGLNTFRLTTAVLGAGQAALQYGCR